MSIFFAWFLRGFIWRIVGTTVAVAAIFSVIEVFDKARFLGKGLDGALLVEYIALKLPFILTEFSPVILLLAAAIFVTEISRTHELAALRSLGQGVEKLLLPLLTGALMLVAAAYAVGEWVTPITNHRLDAIEKHNIQHREDRAQGVQWIRDRQRFYRLTPIDADRFSLQMLEIDRNGGWVRRIDAMQATYRDGLWHLSDVYLSEPQEQEGMRQSHLTRLTLKSSISPDAATLPEPRHMNAMQLWRYTDELQRAGLASSGFELALYRKGAMPLASLIMVVLAVALCANMGGRIGASSLGLIGAIALGLTFYVLGNASGMLSASGQMPVAYAAWLPDLFFGGLAGFLLLQREGY